MTQKAIPQTQSPNVSSGAPSSGSASPPDAAASRLKNDLGVGVREISSEMKHAASEVASGAKKAAESKIGVGKDFAVEHLGSVAQVLRKTGDELRTTKDESAIPDYVDKAASSVEKLSSYLQTRTVSQVMGDVQGFARREPALFLGGAFVAGLLGGRFLKSATPAAGRGGPAPWRPRPEDAARGLPRHAGQPGGASPPSSEHERKADALAPRPGNGTGVSG